MKAPSIIVGVAQAARRGGWLLGLGAWGCLLGSDPLKGAPNVPTLEGEPEVLAPSPAADGQRWVRAGTRVQVRVRFVTPIDLETSELRLDDASLSCVSIREGGATYECEVVLDGTEANGPKGLAGTVSFASGVTSRVASAPLVVADFIPPSASCLLAPRVANARDEVRLVVTPSEPLAAAPVVVADVSGLSVGEGSLEEGQYLFGLQSEAGADLPAYRLSVTATDRAGNPQAGDSMCDADQRQGAIFGSLPALETGPTLEVVSGPSVTTAQGEIIVGEGAQVEVAFTADRPLDRAQTSVQLGEIDLPWHPDEEVWRLEVGPMSPEGRKALRILLVDEAGNTEVVERSDLAVSIDRTPPTGGCLLVPRDANGSDTILFDLIASEPLADPGPVLAGAGPLEVVGPTVEGSTYRWALTSPDPPVDIDRYTLMVTGTDRVGNPQAGSSLCREEERTGRVKGIGPEVDGPIVLSAEPALDIGGTLHVAAGAAITLVLPTASPVDPARSFVALSNIVLSSTDGHTWTGVVGSTAGDGPRTLIASLVDTFGNTVSLEDPSVGVVTDLTPPAIATAVLSRQPSFEAADDGSGMVRFTDRDPLSTQPVAGRLRVTTTEPLGASAVLAVDGPGGLEPVVEVEEAQVLRWGLGPFDGVAEGDHTFTLVLEDRLGNRSDPLPVGVITRVDRTPPEGSPAVDAPGVVLYDRVPWGTFSELAPRFEVTGQAGAVPGGALVALLGPDGRPVSLTQADDQGRFEGLRLSADRPVVEVALVDEAGNVGGGRTVREGRWTASLVGKVVGSTTQNPHRFEEVLTEAPTWQPEGARERRLAPGEPVETSPRARGEVVGSVPPLPLSARARHGMAWDPVRREVVLFGGVDGAFVEQGDTWLRGERSWRQASGQVGGPTPRLDVSMAWDPRRQAVVMFGGRTAGGFSREVWLWDGSRWRDETPEDWFISLDGVTAVTDPVRGVVLLVHRDSETFVWDGQGLTVVSHPGQTAPHDWTMPPPVATWDPVREQVVLLDTALRGWTGDGWEEIPADGPVPPRRFGATFVADPATGHLLLVGGSTEGGLAAEDAWRWDGASWGPLTWDGATPLPRPNLPTAWEGHRERYLSVGGGPPWIAGDFAADAWLWDASGWEALPDAESEPTLADGGVSHVPGVATDPVRGWMVLANGRWRDGTWLHQSWIWDGRGWRSAPGSVPGPVERIFGALAWHPEDEKLYAFGGARFSASDPQGLPDFLGDTFRLGDEGWEAVGPEIGVPGRLAGAAMAWDDLSERLLLFGGAGPGGLSGQTWALEGGTWVDVTPDSPGPSPRYGAAMHTAPGGGVLLHGGTLDDLNPLGDLWWWDGSRWSERASGPSGGLELWNFGHTLLWDPISNSLLAAGGQADGSLWSFGSDERWRSLDPLTGFFNVSGYGLATDPVDGVPILLGPDSSSVPGMMRWHTGAADRSAHHLTFDLSSAQVDEADWLSIQLRWEGGAEGSPGGDLVEGAQLAWWEVDRYVESVSHGRGPDDPGPLCVQVGEPGTEVDAGCVGIALPTWRARLVGGLDRVATRYRVRPVAASGLEPRGPEEAAPLGRLRSADAEVVLRYRLP